MDRFDKLISRSTYKSFGKSGTFTSGALSKNIRLIDETAGKVVNTNSGFGTTTVVPCVLVRASDFVGIDPIGGTIVFGGKEVKVLSSFEDTIDGEFTGDLVLQVEEQ